MHIFGILMMGSINTFGTSKIFEYNQQFEVELQVENEFSCKDTIIKTLEIPKFKPDLYLMYFA